MAHDVMAQCSISFFVNLSISLCTSTKRSGAWAWHFRSFPWTNAHTFFAIGHSQSIWLTVSSWCRHIAQWGSTFTLRLCKFTWVGRIFVQALHIKFLTQIDLHIRAFECARECSPADGYWSLSATLYAVSTEKGLLLFSFHVKTSRACMLVNGILRMSLHVWGSNQ